MYHREFEPPEHLRISIKCFWYDRIDFGKVRSDFEVVPDGYTEIIFYFGNPLGISSNGTLTQLPSPFMMGLLDRPAIFSGTGSTDIIGIRCFPWTVFDLLNLRAEKNGVSAFEHPITALQSTLMPMISDGKINETIAAITHYFLNNTPKTSNDSLLLKAGTAMKEANGTITVSDVAQAAHATVRTLERKFKQSSGHTVKDVSALLRFEQVRNRLLQNPSTNLAGLAEELGYSDQSHLSREFKRYSGTSPATFARNSKRGNGS